VSVNAKEPESDRSKISVVAYNFRFDKTIENIGTEWWESNRPVTRVEFRLFREALAGLGVESLEDFRQRERAIAEYLTKDWFRLLAKPKVRGTENDAEIHELWVRVQNLFFEHFSCAEVPKVEWQKPTRVSVDSKRLIKQGRGCFVSAVIAESGVQKSKAALRNRIIERVYIDDVTLDKGNQKIRRIEVEKGIKFVEQTGIPARYSSSYDCDCDLADMRRDALGPSDTFNKHFGELVAKEIHLRKRE
jgi:hypothetical protein